MTMMMELVMTMMMLMMKDLIMMMMRRVMMLFTVKEIEGDSTELRPLAKI